MYQDKKSSCACCNNWAEARVISVRRIKNFDKPSQNFQKPISNCDSTSSSVSSSSEIQLVQQVFRFTKYSV